VELFAYDSPPLNDSAFNTGGILIGQIQANFFPCAAGGFGGSLFKGAYAAPWVRAGSF
jgi:hypothetical protein